MFVLLGFLFVWLVFLVLWGWFFFLQGIAFYNLKNGPPLCAGKPAEVAEVPAWMNKEILTELKHEKEADKRWKKG